MTRGAARARLPRVDSPSVLDDLARAGRSVADLLAQVPADRWAAPTPCTSWSVRDVVDHLVGMDLVFVSLLTGGPRPDRAADRLGDDPAGAYLASSAGLLAAAGAPGVLEQSATTPLGTTTGAERLRWRVVDLVTHGWDVAQAVGVPFVAPDDVVARSLAFAQEGLPGQPRAGRFDEPQEVADGAPLLDRLAGYTGRPVPWSRG